MCSEKLKFKAGMGKVIQDVELWFRNRKWNNWTGCGIMGQLQVTFSIDIFISYLFSLIEQRHYDTFWEYCTLY